MRHVPRHPFIHDLLNLLFDDPIEGAFVLQGILIVLALVTLLIRKDYRKWGVYRHFQSKRAGETRQQRRQRERDKTK